MKQRKYYASLADARGALAINMGYDPFAVKDSIQSDDGRIWSKPSIAALAALGYPVDVSHARRQAIARAERDAVVWARQASAFRQHVANEEERAKMKARDTADEAKMLAAAREYEAAHPGCGPLRIHLFHSGAISVTEDPTLVRPVAARPCMRHDTKGKRHDANPHI